MEFEITEEDDYAISFQTKGFQELLLLECILKKQNDTAIDNIIDLKDDTPLAIYGEDGRKRVSLRRGINIVKMKSGKTRKLYIQ